MTSNQNLSYRTNTTNNFVMEIQPPINARDGNTYISVNEIFYPTILSNVNEVMEENFYFSFKVTIKNFVKDQRGTMIASGVHFEFETVQIPRGFYDAEMLYNILNKQVRQFGMQFLLEKNKTVSLTYNMFLEYWFLPTKSPAIDGGVINKFRKSGQSIYDDHLTWDIEIKLHLNTSCAFMLGFDNEVVIKQTQSMMTKAVEYGMVISQ